MKYRYESQGVVSEISLERQGEEYLATIAGESHTVRVLSSTPGELNLLFDGRPLRLYWAAAGDRKWIASDGCVYALEKPAQYSAQRSTVRGGEDRAVAPMPAQVRAVLVEPGQTVEAGTPLLLLEAMKMEIRLTAPRSGLVQRVLVEAGQTVEKDQVLVEIGDPV